MPVQKVVCFTLFLHSFNNLSTTGSTQRDVLHVPEVNRGEIARWAARATMAEGMKNKCHLQNLQGKDFTLIDK